jgi:uncharacterized membrane protein YkoI
MKMASLLTLIFYLLFPVAVAASQSQQSTIADNSAGKSAQQNTNKLKLISRKQALQLVKRQYKGKILKAQSSQINGHTGYKVKLISEKGLIFYVSVDAQTGRVSRN